MRIPLLLSALLSISIPAFAACLHYEPARVTLTGKLHRQTFPGAPNFESIKDGDAAETGFYLTLAQPVCTVEDAEREESGFASVKEVQLVLDQALYDVLRPKLGQQVSLSGQLFAGFTGHHHTDVLLTVDKPDK
ncbi:DUF4431 domain-containing protein [Undibacterium sp.]|uniref:DUF4431 domain-containing protein n=1 Tax=Undibacterium sp. TaxID=1914977 RepID=UPI00374D46CD